MEIFVGTIFSVLICGLVFCLFMLHRNEEVGAYRQGLIDKIGEACHRDIRKGILTNTEWRWELFKAVSYEEHLHKFWKPIDSFYDLEKFDL